MGRDYYGLNVPRDLEDKYEHVAEVEGFSKKSKAMVYALRAWLEQWEERQIMMQAEREVEEEKEG